MDEEVERITLMLEASRENLRHYTKLTLDLEEQLREALKE
jgi:hypothetical protein